MSDLLAPRLTAPLARLQRFWTWRRRELVQEVMTYAQATDTHTVRLIAHGSSLQTELDLTRSALSDLQNEHGNLETTLDQLQSAHTAQARQLEDQIARCLDLTQTVDRLAAQSNSQQSEIERTSVELTNQQGRFRFLANAHQELQATCDFQSEQLADCKEELRTLSERHARQSAKLAGVERLHTDLQGELRQLAEKYERLQDQHDLVCAILDREPAVNPALARLKQWLAMDFAQDVQRLDLSARDTAQALAQAHAIAQHVELVADAPMLRDKFLVAVAGGFSAGKSSFVSSFLSAAAAELLPTGINPVTAIPTYVMPGEDVVIEGHTFRGAHLSLTPEAYGELTHDFISAMGFNLKRIMPYVVVQSPMPALEHIAFIDMPGYNAAESEVAHTAADYDIAGAGLIEADAVIWLLGLDSNGTLPKGDIAFLVEHADESKPLYVVLNKADLRPPDAVKQVIQEIQKHLEAQGIPYQGISAYSATIGKEFYHQGESLMAVLEKWDHSTSAAASVHKEFEAMIDGLELALAEACRSSDDAKALTHSLTLDLMELSSQQEFRMMLDSSDGLLSFLGQRFNDLRNDVGDKLQQLRQVIAGMDRSNDPRILRLAREHGHELLRACLPYADPVTSEAHT